MKIEHTSVSNNLFVAQADFVRLLTGLTTAQHIIKAKIINSRGLLTKYRQGLRRSGSSLLEKLLKGQDELARIGFLIEETRTIQELTLLEARAGKIYWNAFKNVARRGQEWARVYPQAKDICNILLNTGYTQLTRVCETALVNVGVFPHIGIMHASERRALVYDFMEIFRHSAVDAVILPAFSRKGLEAVLNEKTSKKYFARIHGRYTKVFWYQGKYETLSRIIEREAVRLRNAMQNGIAWKPYVHRWGNTQK